MVSTYYDRVSCAAKASRTSTLTFQGSRRVIEEEFSEEFRDPRFPAGWYILPFFSLAIPVLMIVYF
jgi:hypothetical protein